MVVGSKSWLPVGRQFLHVLKEDLVADFCKTPNFLMAFGDTFLSLLDVGRQFALKKQGIEDTSPTEDLKELAMDFPTPVVTLGIDESLPLDHPWWMPSLKKDCTILTQGSFSDASFPPWGVMPYSVLPLPDTMVMSRWITKNMISLRPGCSLRKSEFRITISPRGF